MIESVKAAADIYAPVSGEIVAANEELADQPEKINEDAYAAWMFRIKPSDAGELAGCSTPPRTRKWPQPTSTNAVHSPHRRRRPRDARGDRRRQRRGAVRRDTGVAERRVARRHSAGPERDGAHAAHARRARRATASISTSSARAPTSITSRPRCGRSRRAASSIRRIRRTRPKRARARCS